MLLWHSLDAFQGVYPSANQWDDMIIWHLIAQFWQSYLGVEFYQAGH